MRKLTVASLILGAAALAWLIVHLGPATLYQGLLSIGTGLIAGCVLHGAGLVLDSVTLQACASTAVAPPLGLLVRASVTGHALNEATPMGKVGEVTKFAVISEVMDPQRAAAALVAQNLVMFVVNCALLAVAPLLAGLVAGASTPILLGLCGTGAVLLAVGLGVVWILDHGLGAWPFSILRRLRVGAERVARWRTTYLEVEGHWRAVAGDRRRMAIAWTSAVVSKLCNVAEAALYFGLAGGDHVISAGFLSQASAQAIAWVAGIVPFGVGTGEGGAYAVFKSLGLSGEIAVIAELARKLRRVVFVTVGVGLLAFTATRRPRREP